MTLDLRFHPLTEWPAKPTPAAQRKSRYSFRARWDSTLELLEVELGHLRARDVIISAGLRPEDIRIDGWPRSNAAEPGHPGVMGDLSVSNADDVRLDDWTWPEPVDAVEGKPSYLWSARHFVGRARYELSCGRYREGHCPDLDEVNRLLGRLEEELRLMAFAADPSTASIAEDERAEARARAARHAPEKVVVFS